MSFQDEYKITSADRLDKGVYGLPDTPGMTTAAIQERFDSLGNLAIDKFNALVEAASDVIDGSDTKFPTNKAVEDYISGEGGAIIDDTTPSLHKAYSSQKVENMFSDVASRVIDDTEPLSNKTYSSEEIEEKLSNIPSPESIIDDDTASADKTYSSSKLESDFISVSDTEEQTATDEFSTINGGLLSECKVSLTPNQDLHGYDHPWVGGAGKNLLPITVANVKALNTAGTWSGNEYTFKGVTYTVNTDEDGNVISIKAVGTASELSYLYLQNQTGSNYSVFAGKSCILNGCPANGSSSTYSLSTYGSGMTVVDYGSGATITFPSTEPSNWNIAIGVISGYSIPTAGIIFYPMIRLSTESDATFEPYSNICPITGHTQVEVGDDGKNRFENTLTDGTTSGITRKVNSDGSIETSGTASENVYVTISDVELKAGTYIASSGSNGSWSTSGIYVRNVTDSATINMIESESGLTFTLTAKKTIRLILYVANGQTVNKTFYPMIRLASDTDPTYVPYNGYQVTVNLGGTYYSGVLDVVTGVFVPDKAKTIIDENSAIYNWNSPQSPWCGFVHRISDQATGRKLVKTNYTTSIDGNYSSWNAYSVNQDIYVCMNENIIGGRTIADMSAYLATHPLEVVYELATPTPIQLSPTMVKALVGENHLSAPLDGQEITESVYSPLAKWNAVIDDTTASNDTTYSSNKINAIVPQIDDNSTSATKVFSSLKTASLITELSERFDFSTTEKPLGWWTDGKVYYGKVINIAGCPKEMFGLMVDLGVEVDTFIGLFAVGDAQDDNYNGGYCMGGTIYCRVIKSEGQNTQIQPACAVMALSGASLLVLYTKA